MKLSRRVIALALVITGAMLTVQVPAAVPALSRAAPAGAAAAGDRAAQVVQSGPAALTQAARGDQGRYLIRLAATLLHRSEPSAWVLAALILQEQRDAIGLALPGGQLAIIDGHPVENSTIEQAFRRARSEGMSDPATLMLLSSSAVPGLFQTAKPEMMQRLVEVDGRNAMAWLRSIFRASNVAAGKERYAIQRASSADRYDDYHAHVVRLFLTVSDAMPPPELMQDDGHSRAADVSRLLLAVYLGQRYEADTGSGHVPLVCTRPGQDMSMRSFCHVVLRKLIAQPTTFRALESALQAMSLVAANDLERADLARQQRAASWQQRKLYELGFAVADVATEVDATLADWMRGGTEVSVGRARLQRHRIALAPPDGWQPQPHTLVPLR